MFKLITISELLKELDNYNFKELHVHHTWKPSHKDFNGNNGIELQEAMKAYHMRNNGWSDIGQHVTLLPDGLFVTGRDFRKQPASITGYNYQAFAVEILGNFDVGFDKLEGPQKQSMLKLARYFYDKGLYIRFHRENSTKTCPGSSISKITFMKEVEDMSKFTDVPDNRWSAKYINAVEKLGIMNGFNDGTFKPELPVTREQMAAIIIRLYEKIKGEKLV